MASGQTSAAAAGGGNYDVAWLDYVWNTDDTFPFVFQPGMTWGQYIDSEYRLYYDYTYQFGFAPAGNNIKFCYGTGSSMIVSDETYHMVQQNEQIVSGYHYILMA